MLSDLSGYSKKGFNSSHTILKLCLQSCWLYLLWRDSW